MATIPGKELFGVGALGTDRGEGVGGLGGGLAGAQLGAQLGALADDTHCLARLVEAQHPPGQGEGVELAPVHGPWPFSGAAR